jgi:hypothetical protein
MKAYLSYIQHEYFHSVAANIAEQSQPGRGETEGSTYFPLLINLALHPVLGPDYTVLLSFPA